MLGETTLNFPVQSESLHQPCSSQVLESKQVFTPVQCHTAACLEAAPVHPLDCTLGHSPRLAVLKTKWFGFYSFLILCCYLCPGSDGAPQACRHSYAPYTSCGNAGMSTVSGSDTDRSHTAPKELLKCYKDEPYGQPQCLRPLIGIFKQLWLMRQLLQVWDQWKCNLIFWTRLLNFFAPFSAENPIKPFLCRQKLSGTLHVDLSCIFLFLPPPPCL